MDTHFMAKIMANIRDFQNNVRKAQRLAKTAVPNEIETDVKADISRFQRALQRAKAMAQKWREHNVKIDGNNSPLKRAITSARTMLATLHTKTVKVNFDTRGMTKAQILTKALNKSLTEYGEKMDALASKIRTFGTIFAQQVKGLMIASIQALIPVIAGLVPAIMAVLNAVGVLGGGVLGLAGAFSIAGAGAVAFGAMAISAIKMLKDGTLQVTKETQAYQSALNGVKTTWQDIIKQNQAQIFNTLANGLNTIKTALIALKPFISGVAQSMEQASQKVLKWAQNSQTAQKFFNMMNTTGVKTFDALLSAAGRFGDGLVNVFTQLAPLFLWVANGLDSLGQKFQNWANSVAGQNAIQAFIEYTKTNLPKLGQIFGNVFSGIGNLMIAFGQNSSNIFDWLVKLTSQFRAWSEQVGQSQGFKDFISYVQENGPTIMQLIGNIVKALVAFGTAMAPIASKLLDFITNLAGFIAKLFETHPAVAQIIGVMGILGGVFWALMAPIAAVSSVLSNVFSMTLLNVVKRILDLTRITGLVSKAFGLLAGAFTSVSWPVLAVIAVIGAFIGILVYLWKTNENFRKTITEAWNGIKTAVSGAIQGVVDWLTQLWGKIQSTLQPIMPILQMLGQIFMQVLGVLVIGIITNVMNIIQGLWTLITIAFQAIGTVISVAVQIIVGLFTALIQLLTGDFSGAWETIKTTVTNVLDTIWQYMQSVWESIIGFLTGVMNRTLSMFGTSWSQIWSTITNFVSSIWNTVTSWFSRVASSVAEKMGQALNFIITKGSEWVSNIWNTVTSFASKVADGFKRVVSNVGDGMSDALGKIKSFFSDFLNAGAELIGKVAEGVANAAHKVVSAVGDAISSAWDSVTSFVSGHGGGSGLGKGLAVSQAKVIATDFGSAFNKELSSTLTDSIVDPVSTSIDRHMTGDVQHSLKENNRPIVNVTIRNEGDLDLIKSRIDDMNAIDGSFNLL
ncbi:TPA: terminase [Staphylococcus aureus]|uniref:phage tail protein n=1 Tax=Staphylococcus aureus TaxID=1280 RepID=UPI0005DBF67F|nr:terminase [Staphylococcus aureus]COW92866.1 phage tape measure protein [Staphylococcus aureus]COW97915.1 phage tape measure protein [Staphylococcus aureus]COX20871.1 phage tape measure protein [Staphylococcus aureus]HBH9999812.1 terminase [Staphylococcus aureus]HBI0005195.1 terminase [Staphylococcus aureus]